MLTDFDFHLLQLRYIQAAAAQIPTYRPDSMDAAALGAVITNAKAVRQAYIDAKSDFDLARGEYREAINNGHDASIGVYAAMKSRYRKDPGSLQSVEALPVDDRSADETTKRMQQTSSLWGKLPNIGTPPAPFVAWQGMGKTDFDAILTTITTRQETVPDKDQAFQVAEGNLHETDADLSDLVTAALQQGRAQFRSGASREVIDAVPTEPATSAPAQAAIAQFSSPGAGSVHLAFDATHGTTFDVLQKAPGAPAFVKVVDDGVLKTFDATGLTPGAYQYQVIGRNSVGQGPASPTVTITVT
ncbi:MAG: fibronectin type III domain-containing protein [Chthoniobacterales bacterium]